MKIDLLNHLLRKVIIAIPSVELLCIITIILTIVFISTFPSGTTSCTGRDQPNDYHYHYQRYHHCYYYFYGRCLLEPPCLREKDQSDDYHYHHYLCFHD